MAIKKPLVQGSGNNLLDELQSGDTISTSDISDFLDKRFLTDEQKNIICKNYYVGVVDVSSPTFNDNGDGTGTISGCTIAIRDNSNHAGYIREYSVSQQTFEFIDGEQEYIAVYYNSGDPVYQKTSVMPNGSDRSLIYVVWRVGLTLHSANQDSIGLGLPNKQNSRLLNTEPYAVSSLGGLLISESTSPSPRTINVSSAIVYIGNNPISVESFNSSVDNMYKVILTSSGWNYTIVTQYDNNHYNPGSSGEVLLDNNKYKFNLYYRSIGDSKDVFFVESENQYNSAAEATTASEAGRTTIPIVLKNHCVFIGRSVIQKGATSGVTSPFIRTRGSYTTYIPSHNDLPGIQGGAVGEYYHVTSSEKIIIGSLPKIGDISGGNYTEFEADGTMVAIGDATCWDDIALGSGALGAGASAPDLININNSGIYLYGFAGAATIEQLYGSFEVPHNYKEGTDLIPHIHWLTTTTNTGNVKWQVDYWRVNMTTITAAPSIPLNIVALGTASGTAWKNNRSFRRG